MCRRESAEFPNPGSPRVGGFDSEAGGGGGGVISSL